MTAASDDARAATVRLRCTHCGRPVRETLHTREAWRVDYYLLHTGEVEPATMARDDDRGLISFVKLISNEDVITCVDCYGNPRVRSEREDRFRPERRLEAAG